jgi:hypothetical protein
MPRPLSGTTGIPCNIYLAEDVKKAAREVARVRYGYSLSELIERLLRKETAMKRGMLPSTR